MIGDEEEEIDFALQAREQQQAAASNWPGPSLARLSDADDSILPQLAETQRLLRELEKIDPAHGGCFPRRTQPASSNFPEISRSLSGYAEQLDLDPEQLAALEERVSLFETLKRKYGGSIGGGDCVWRARAGTHAQNRRARRGTRTAEPGDRKRPRGRERTGRALQKLRAKAAPKLSGKIRTNLRDLGFRQSEFEPSSPRSIEPARHGFDAVELLFSPNPGEPLKPLRAIASSGEISRLMLAVKSALAAQDAIPLLVFDEIDANVGGEIANAVGAKMRTLASEASGSVHHTSAAGGGNGGRAFCGHKGVTKGRTHSRLNEVREAREPRKSRECSEERPSPRSAMPRVC